MHIFALIYCVILTLFTLLVISSAFVPSMQFLLKYGKTLPDSDRHSFMAATVPKRFFRHFYILGTSVTCIALTFILLCKSCDNLRSDYDSDKLSLIENTAAQSELLVSRRSDLTSNAIQLTLCRLSCNLFSFLSATNCWAKAIALNYGVESILADEGVTLEQAIAGILLELSQCVRRLIECSLSDRVPSKANIRVGHYIVGIVFYTGVALCVWIDALDSIIYSSLSWSGTIRQAKASAGALLAYSIAATAQMWIHYHLRTLKKYTLPMVGPFRWILCPHYTAEIAIYMILSTIVRTPAMKVMAVWTLINLCVSAAQSRSYYETRFGSYLLRTKWTVIPFVY